MRHVGASTDKEKDEDFKEKTQYHTESSENKRETGKELNKPEEQTEELARQPTALPAFLQGGLRRSQTQVS